MPFKETCAVDQRMRLVARWSEDEGNFSALCREFGISRKTGYEWLGRYEREGPGGLEDREPLAAWCPHRTLAEIEDRLVLARKEHPSWGPRKVRSWLHDKEPLLALPAISTVGDIFKRRGLVRPRKRRLRVPIERLPRAEALGPNEIWSADFKGHFRLGDGSRCHPLTIADVYSRYFLKCEGLAQPREEPVQRQFELAFQEFGLPQRIRTDNGVPFASTAAGGLTGLAVWWIKLGIVPERIDPGHPEQNGRHERMHRTLKDETTKPPGSDMAVQQRAFDEFRHDFNDERPHEALEDRPPGRIYALSLRPYPAQLRSPEYGEELEVRKVFDNSTFAWRGKRVQLPTCLVGERVGLREVADGYWEVRYGPIVLGAIDERAGGPPRLLRALCRAASEPGSDVPVTGNLCPGAGASTPARDGDGPGA